VTAAAISPALDDAELAALDAHWRAANYLSAGQIYLLDNPLLREPLRIEHIKPRLLGHWGTTPGLNFVYVHLNRLIRRENNDVLFVAGPGHGGPGLVANAYLEGTYAELYPETADGIDGMRHRMKQFSFPGGIGSHANPETPGSIHEGGELGYSLAHAYGAAFDDPDLLVACLTETARPRRVRSRRVGTPTSSSIRSVTVPCCRSCTSTVTRSRTRPRRTSSWHRRATCRRSRRSPRRNSFASTSPICACASWKRSASASSKPSYRAMGSGGSPIGGSGEPSSYVSSLSDVEPALTVGMHMVEPALRSSHLRQSFSPACDDASVKPVFQHITVPVDGSTTSARGVTFALELARDGGLVSFCSVVDPMLAYAPAAYGVAVDPGPMIEVLDDDAGVFCREAHGEATKHAVAADMTVLHGQSVDQIEAFAAGNGSDAIVIGTHGRSGVVRAMLGSVAEGVLRRMDIPVVSVHDDDVMRTGPIAVAMDSSPAAQAALELAIRIAGARGMPLLLVHVNSRSPNGTTVAGLLDDAVVRARSHGIAAQLVVDEGGPADELLRAADAHDCCMIVMGTHGREALVRLVLGSVAAAVVERAQIPVVTVRCAA